MDEVLKNGASDDQKYPGMYFAVLAVLCCICVAVGWRIAGVLSADSVRFYGRYEGLSSAGITDHLKEAVISSAPTLAELAVLLLMSASPLLFPACAVIAGSRGIMAGAALAAVSDVSGAAQVVAFVICTGIMCMMCADLLTKRTGVIRRIAVFFAASGGCVAAESLLSFIT